MLAYGLYLFLAAFSVFLLGLSIFMYFEERKFGDNQFMVKLLPPPPIVVREAAVEAPERKGDWTPAASPLRSALAGRALTTENSRVSDYAGEPASPAV